MYITCELKSKKEILKYLSLRLEKLQEKKNQGQLPVKIDGKYYLLTGTAPKSARLVPLLNNRGTVVCAQNNRDIVRRNSLLCKVGKASKIKLYFTVFEKGYKKYLLCKLVYSSARLHLLF